MDILRKGSLVGREVTAQTLDEIKLALGLKTAMFRKAVAYGAPNKNCGRL